MKTYRVIREITVKVYDYVEAENYESAKTKVNEMKPLLNEVSDTVNGQHSAAVFKDYTENVEEVCLIR